MNVEVAPCPRTHVASAGGKGVPPALSGIPADRVVAIVGAGPAGCALAIRLAQRGVPVVVFDSGRRPSLTVGESLVPAAMPHLRTLGVEREVLAGNVHKPGALLVHGSGERADFRFRALGARAPGYACNVARPRFDETLARRARQLGVRFVPHRAGLIAGPPGAAREIALDERSLARLDADPGPDGCRHPALLVDATGRARVFARRLGLTATRGERDDVACFAHFEGMRHDDAAPGQIVISVLRHGWSWRIPLEGTRHGEPGPGRVSVGVVVPRETSDGGESAAERLERAMREEPLLAEVSCGASRCSRALRYEHYRLVGERAGGPGWVAVGDAFGFVDPMLSPGVFMALEAAVQLNDRVRITRDGRPQVQDLVGYERTLHAWFDGWNRVIETFYDGRMLALQRAARQRTVDAHGPGARLHRAVEACVRRAIAELVSGTGTRSRLAQAVLARSAGHLLRDAGEQDLPARFAVRRPDVRR